MQIKNNVVLVTGGSSGLGEACVHLLTQMGAKVVIVDLNEEAGTTLAERVGETALFVKGDVTAEDEVQKAIKAAIDNFGSLSVTINCAGIGLAEKTVSKRGPHSLQNFSRVISINLIGTFNVLRLAAAAMAENPPDEEGERGVIINTASTAAFDGQIGQAAYAASKGGIVGMTLPLARDLASYGIRVMTIAPGIFDTPLMAGLPEAARTSLEQQTLFPPRLGRPAEYAALAKHIIESPMLNGEVIRLDGAMRLPYNPR